MTKILFLAFVAFLITSCQPRNEKVSIDAEKIKAEIVQAEKAFATMVAEKGLAEAFYHFADSNAVIKRENDTLIIGNKNIKAYYARIDSPNTTVNWSPDFVDVAEDGTMAFTYGKYVWKVKNETGAVNEFKGVFHTVWKRQKDGTWKYVWD